MIDPITLPPQAYLKECLRYEAATGKLFWKARPVEHFKHAGTCRYWNRRYAGTPAFNIPTEWGYLRGNLDKRAYLAHRVVWKLVRGTEPPPLVDHEDQTPTNNRDENLREATTPQNCINSAKRSKVSFDKGQGKWRARTTIDGKRIHIGWFVTEEAALQAQIVHSRAVHGEFAPR